MTIIPVRAEKVNSQNLADLPLFKTSLRSISNIPLKKLLLNHFRILVDMASHDPF